jgi:hypothetical protein
MTGKKEEGAPEGGCWAVVSWWPRGRPRQAQVERLFGSRGEAEIWAEINLERGCWKVVRIC